MKRCDNNKEYKMQKENNTNSKTVTRKIKNTVYEITVHFSKTSRETMSDKVSRLIRNEVAS